MDDFKYMNGRWTKIVDHEFSTVELLQMSHETAESLWLMFPGADKLRLMPRYRQSRLPDGRYELEIL